MAYYEDIFAILGIKPTKDVGVIKRAYEAKQRKYDLEKHAEKWQEVRYAYQRAMVYAGNPAKKEEKPAPPERLPNTRERKRPKVSWLGTLLSILLVIFTFIWEVGDFSLDFLDDLLNKNVITEERAGLEILAYLEEKYPEKNFALTDFDIYTNKTYSSAKGKDVKCGYYATIHEQDVRVYLFVEKDGEEERIICFDDIQKNEVKADIEEYLLEKTGVETGMFFFGRGDDVFSTVFLQGETFFHERYNGDIDKLLMAEIQNNRDLKDILYTALEVSDEEYKKTAPVLNGVGTLYIKDTQVTTIADRIYEPMRPVDQNIPKVLEEYAKKWRLQIDCIGLPAQYYDKITSLNAEGDLEYELTNLVLNSYENEMPSLPHLTTVWYRTGIESLNREMVQPEVYEFKDGIYVMATTRLLQQDMESLQIRSKETPPVYKEYFEKKGGYEKAVNLECYINRDELVQEGKIHSDDYDTLDEWGRQQCVLIFDKAKLGIKGSDYIVGTTDSDNEDVEGLWILKSTSQTSDQLAGYNGYAVETDGFISVKMWISEENWSEVITIAQ